MAGVPRPIIGFAEDERGVWVATLECGHTQHVRHEPPWQLRPWTLTEEGRNEHLGALLDCVKCSMPELPQAAERYKVIGPFDQSTIPEGLLNDHSLKRGVWGRIVVAAGRLKYTIERTPEVEFVLEPGTVGIVLPEEAHRIEAMGPVDFTVEFWRKSSAG